MWPSGQVVISEVDADIESAVSTTLDDIERKTLVTFVRGKTSSQRSIAIHAVSRLGMLDSGIHEVCCFDASKASQRQLTIALMRAVGAVPDAGTISNTTAVGLRLSEADAINKLYIPELIPASSKLPALVQVGVWQLAPGRKAAADWSSMIGGRGRRVVAGTSRWAAKLKGLGVIGAVPTFIFHGNKAQVLLLGSACAEVVPGSMSSLPLAGRDEGLGAGIQRAMLHARSKGAVGGWPTHLGDGSILMVHASCAALSTTSECGETIGSILTEHRSAIALSQVARWAQGRGALYGLPSFASVKMQSKQSQLDLEVMLIGPGVEGDNKLMPIMDEGSPFLATLTLAGMFTGVTFVGWHFFKRTPVSQAERDLEFVVDSL